MKVSILLETGEARELHHFSVLFGYGAEAINPYLAFETIDKLSSSKDKKVAKRKFCKGLW